MNEWAVTAALLGVSVFTALVMGVLCRLLGGWSWMRSRIAGNKEETAKLTKAGQFAANGYLVNSESDIALDTSGNYKHYDNVVSDLKFIQETDNSIPVEPSSSSSLLRTSSYYMQIPEEPAAPEPDIPRALSCDSVCSDTSVIPEALELPQHNGELEIGMEYDDETEDLIVMVNRAKDLIGLDPSIPVDCYVRVFLLPDRSTNMQTRIHKKSNNPIFKERFLFGVDRKDLEQRSILCTVCACNKYNNTVIGESEVKLSDVDLSQPIVSWVPVLDSNQGPADLGDILFSLSYLPTAERLTVVIVKARDLNWKSNSEKGDPFVKVYLLKEGKKTSKKKTSSKKDEKNPIFNEAVIFSVPSLALTNIQLRITVAEQSSNGKTVSLGHVFVGPQCKGKSLCHWTQMMSSLRKPVPMWHPLRKLTQ